MKRISFGLVSCFWILLGFGVYGQVSPQNLVSDEQGRETGYIYAFSEATKMFIFGDYGRAANLYNECLKYEPKSAAVNYQMAELYLKAGDIKTAHGYSLKACLFEPANKWYKMQLANIYQSEQMFDSAIFIYKTMLIGSDAEIKVFFQISSLYEKMHDFKSAMEYLNLVEGKIGVTRESAVNKSRVYDELGMKKEALAELRKTIVGREDDYILYGMIAEFYRNHRNADSAEYYYNKILSEHQEDANLMFSYGEFLLEQKKDGEARTLYATIFGNSKIDENVKYSYLYNSIQNQGVFIRVRPVIDTAVSVLLKNYPDNIRVMSLYSDVNYRLGNYAVTSRMLERIIAKDEKNFTAWEQLLFCESAMDRSDSVMFYGQQAISKFENRPLPYLMVSSVLYTEKNYRKAIGLLEKGEDLAETDALKIEFYSLLAECYGRIEDTVKSDKYYEDALLIDSVNVAILNNYAYSLAVRGYNIEKAESMSRYTIDLEPMNGTYLDTYAWILFNKKDYKGANQYIKKALAYGEDKNAEVLEHYGEILFRMGKTRKAISVLNEAKLLADAELKEKLNAKIERFTKERL